nr:putative ribonuclease H-like domain-containing protein [Tanacetum cinerariifolium]
MKHHIPEENHCPFLISSDHHKNRQWHKFKNQIIKEYVDSVGISHQASSVRTPQQNRVVEQRNRTLVDAARTMLIFSRAPLFLCADAIDTAALCYPKNDREDIGKLGAKDTTPTPTISSSLATNFPNTSQDVDRLETQQQHAQQQENQAPLEPKTIVDNVPSFMFDDNTFANPFATPSISAAESSFSQYVDPSNMHTFYQPYPHEYQ